jgi:hypothetical protein
MKANKWFAIEKEDFLFAFYLFHLPSQLLMGGSFFAFA